MAGLYTKQGMDLDSWFRQGKGTQFISVYDNSGLDIGQKFLAGSSRAAVGIQIHDGTDLCSHFGSSVMGIFRTGELAVSGQSNLTGAFNAGFDILEDFDDRWEQFVDVTNAGSEVLGHDQAYRWTRYWCWRVRIPRVQTGTITIGWREIDGGNGAVSLSEIKGSNLDKYFVTASHGGDKGHYGESQLTIQVRSPAYNADYFAKIWTDTD